MATWDVPNQYHIFLKSPQWKKLVQEVRQRESCICESCGSTTRYGHVHHVTYRYGWLCDAKHLKYLCYYCHESEHDENLSWLEIQNRIKQLGTY